METAKTLSEMSFRERLDLIDVVTSALEVKADEAMDIGDASFAANCMNLALAIRGSSRKLASENLHATELILRHGISLADNSASKGRATATTIH